jgi:hypothetical protein
MMNTLRKYQYQIFLVTMCIFFFGMFVGFGGYFFAGKGGGSDAIAEVDGEKIPLRTFYSHYRQSLDQIQRTGKPVEDAAKQQKRDEVTRDMVQAIVFAREAERFGLQVPDKQVVISLAQQPGFQEKGVFSPRLYMQYLQSELRMSPQDFEEEQRKAIAFFKLRWLIQSCIKVTDKEFELEAAFRRAHMPAPANAKEKAKLPKDSELRAQMWQEKVLYSFNQWFSQLGRNLKVKTHFELLEGTR